MKKRTKKKQKKSKERKKKRKVDSKKTTIHVYFFVISIRGMKYTREKLLKQFQKMERGIQKNEEKIQ